MAIEDDDSIQGKSTSAVKGFPLDDATVKEETSSSNSPSKTSSLGHNRSSSFPGNISVATEGSTEKKSRVNGQEILFTEITKSISLPDNSTGVDNVAEIIPQQSKNSSFDLEDFLENVKSEPRYDTEGEGVRESPIGDDTGNFVLEAADLFVTQPRVNRQETDSQEFQNITKRYSDKEISTDIPTVSEKSGEPVPQPQEDSELRNNDLFQSRNAFGSERFNATSSTTKGRYSQEKDLYQGVQSLDSFRVYSLTEDDSSNETNFSIAQLQVPNVVKRRVTEEEAATNEPAVNESQGSNSVNLDDLQISKVDMKNDAIVAQEYQTFRYSPTGKSVKQEKIDNEGDFDKEEFRNDSYDYDEATTGESQPGAIEPVLLLDSGESLLPMAEGDRDMAKTGAQSTFYCAPDVSSENDRDSASLSR